MKRFPLVALIVAAVTLLPAPASAEEDYFARQPTEPLTYRVEGNRSTTERLVIGALLGGAAVAVGVGVHYHLASRDAADEVTAHSGSPVHLIYTPAVDQRREDGLRFKTNATVSYAIGGGFLVGALVAVLVTSPADELREYGASEGKKPAVPVVVPLHGGLLVGGTWSY
jgi:hypothetical protein